MRGSVGSCVMSLLMKSSVLHREINVRGEGVEAIEKGVRGSRPKRGEGVEAIGSCVVSLLMKSSVLHTGVPRS